MTGFSEPLNRSGNDGSRRLPPSKRTSDGSVLGYNLDRVLDIPELMTRPDADKRADMKAHRRADKEGTSSDRHEPIRSMEPMLISESSRFRNGLVDLSVEIAARSSGFRSSLPRGIVAALADLVRSMNCYYSNLIEGHDIHPIDIERALKNDYSKDVGKRNLELEAKAHIEVQRWIDEGAVLSDGSGVIRAAKLPERVLTQDEFSS